jgi:hypothetical protein
MPGTFLFRLFIAAVAMLDTPIDQLPNFALDRFLFCIEGSKGFLLHYYRITYTKQFNSTLVLRIERATAPLVGDCKFSALRTSQLPII